MSPPPAPFDTEELLAQFGWVRALARRVASDAHGAEDLAQDAMLVALRGGAFEALAEAEAGRLASLRRWLAAVVRNLGRTQQRSGRRRAAREVVATERELPPSTLELVERAALQRELAGAVLELDEPYRSTLLLRFFEECSQREIAERMGVPVSTVGTRVGVGLARLRRRFGARESWLSSMLVFLRRPVEWVQPALISGVAIVSLQAKLILGAVVCVGALIALRGGDGGAPAALEREGQADHGAAGASLVGAASEGRREVSEVEEPVVEEARALGFHDIPEHAGIVLTSATVHGRIVDVDGNAVGGLEVCRFRPGGTIVVGTTQSATSALELGCVTADATGRFEVAGRLPFSLSVRDENYATLFEGVVHRETDEEVVVVVARRIPLAGVVVDDEGLAVEGVRVTVHGQNVRPGFDLSRARAVVPETLTDAQGGFELEGAAAIDGAQMQYRAAGFVTQLLPVPEGGDGALVITLSRSAEGLYTIGGHVVLDDGSPAVGALVSTGVLASPTDEQGYFVIDFEPWLEFRVEEDAPTVITAVLPGLLPASVTLPSLNEARESGWPEDLVIELSGEPLTITGIVVDEEGAPQRGVLVEPSDMSEFGFVPSEDLPGRFGPPKTQEQLSGGGAVYTGSDGRFELQGLMERRYSLRAIVESSLLCVISNPIAAGARDVRLVLDRTVLGALEGRVVDRHGVGIPGVSVSASYDRAVLLMIGRSDVTDADGAFRIDDVTTAPQFMRLDGEAIVPELFRTLAEGDDVANLELRVGRRCRVQFDWGAWSGRSDELVVVDGSEEPLMLMRVGGGSIGQVPSVRFQEGLTDVLVVSDQAAHVVVYRDDVEVTRVRLELDVDELNLIQM